MCLLVNYFLPCVSLNVCRQDSPNPSSLLPHHHVKAKGSVGLVHNPLFGLSVQLQLVHPASVKLLEAFVTVDALKLVEVETLTSRGELQCSLGHFLEDLTT